MTTPEFLRALEQVSANFVWRLQADTGHNADRRSKPRFHLTATPKADRSVRLGPLQALCYSQDRLILSSDQWKEAAEAAGVSMQDAAAVVAAASDRTWTGTEGSRTPSEELTAMRRALLEAVGLIVTVPA